MSNLLQGKRGAVGELEVLDPPGPAGPVSHGETDIGVEAVGHHHPQAAARGPIDV